MNKQDKYRSIATGGTFFMYSNTKMTPIIAKLLTMMGAISINHMMCTLCHNGLRTCQLWLLPLRKLQQQL